MWAELQARTREDGWPTVERELAALPPELFRQAKLLEYDLAVATSGNGQFRDAFTGVEHFPLLSIAGWLRADLQPASAVDNDLQRGLLLAGVLLAMRSHLLDSLADPLSSYETSHAALLQYCSERSVLELSRFIPSDSSFWEQHRALTVAGLEEWLAESRGQRHTATANNAEVGVGARWSVPARLLALAGLEVSGAAELGPPVEEAVHRLAVAFAIIDDLASMHRDLLNGRLSYPILVVAEAAGILLDQPPEPTMVLGALLLTGSLQRLLEEAERLICEARDQASELGLPTLSAFIDDAQPAFAERLARAKGGGPRERAGTSSERPRAPLVRIVEPAPAKATAMAARFLLADPELRESWEVHREGMFGADEVVSRFPAGLILETLAGAGHDVAAPLARYLEQTVANGFRYYDHRWCDADSDTLGVFLRLQARMGARAEHAQPLAVVLDCLDRDVAENGFVPVWITACSGPDPERPPMITLGEYCGTVAANLLLGLCATGAPRCAATMGAGATQLLQRISEVGLGANVDYPPLYALGVFFRLLRALQDAAPDTVPASVLASARAALEADLLRRSAARRLSAQDAALSMIACRAAERPELVADEWTTTILKQQRPDGGWLAEPFAAVPNRGGWVSWYASSLLTTSLCYEALQYRYLG